jgi:hypothetical protein
VRVPDTEVAKVMRLAIAERLRARSWAVYGLYLRPRGRAEMTLSLASLDDVIGEVFNHLTAVRTQLADIGDIADALDAVVAGPEAVLRGVEGDGLLGVGFIGATLTEDGRGATARLVLASGTVHTGFQDPEATEPTCQIRTGTDARQAIAADELLAALDRLLQALTTTTS